MTKNPAVLLLLVWCWFTPAVLAQEKPGRANNSLQSFADEFWQWRARYQPFSQDDIPRIDHPAGPRRWSAESIARQRIALRNYETRWKSLNTQGWDRSQQVDYRLIGSAIARVRWELDLNRRWERDPSFYLDQTLTALLEALVQPPPFDANRSREIVVRMDEIPGILEEGKKNLHSLRPFAELAIADLQQIRPKLMRVQTEVAPLLAGRERGCDHALPGDSGIRLDSDAPAALSLCRREWLRGSCPCGSRNCKHTARQVP